jgi:hypothetical protein
VKRWIGLLSVVVLACVALAGIAELALRATGFSYYWSLYREPDPVTGWRPRPGSEAWQRIEGEALVSINAAGFRDREHTREKPADTFRIAVLGDSFTAAVQVPLEETYWRLLEGRLAGCPALGERHPEVLSLSVSGYSTAQELLTLRRRAWDYAPDLVLLAFFQGNDLNENLRALNDDPLRPYFVLRDGALVLDDAFLASPEYRSATAWPGRLRRALLAHSRLAQAADRALDLWALRAHRQPPADGELREPGVDNRIYRAPQDPAWAATWEVTEALLAQMHREVQAHDARFAVATLSTGAQVHPNPAARAAFAEAVGADDLYYVERRIQVVGQREGFPVMSLAPELGYSAAMFGVMLHGFENSVQGAGHWNAEGHAMAADLIAEALCGGDLLRRAGLGGEDSTRIARMATD